MLGADFARTLASAANIIVPTAMGNAVEFLPVCFAIAFVGHQPHLPEHALDTELAAMALARSYFNTVAMAVGFGLITPLRTLCPQAVGAGKPQQCALALQRALLAVCIGALPAIPLLCSADRVLRWLGQRAEVAELARQYSVRLIPQYFGCVGMSVLQRIFQAHGHNWANFAICAAVCVAAPAIQALLVWRLRLGFLGAAWAASAYNMLYIVLQVPTLHALGHAGVLRPQPLRAVFDSSGVRAYARLAAPGFVMCTLEWWVVEVVVVLSGVLHHPLVATSTMSVAGAVQSLGMMAWIGCAVGSANLVGTAIGAGDLPRARRGALAVLTIAVALGGTLGVGLALLRQPLSRVFTQSAGIDALTARLLPVMGAVLAADAMNNTIGGICSGLGLLKVGAASQLVGYYVVGMPVGIWLAFARFHASEDGVLALWGGVFLAVVTSAVLQTVCLARHNWQRAVDAGAERVRDDEAASAAAAARARVAHAGSAASESMSLNAGDLSARLLENAVGAGGENSREYCHAELDGNDEDDEAVESDAVPGFLPYVGPVPPAPAEQAV